MLSSNKVWVGSAMETLIDGEWCCLTVEVLRHQMKSPRDKGLGLKKGKLIR